MRSSIIVLIFVFEITLSLSDDGSHEKSSLVFVFDTTGSMYDDLYQLRESAELILKTALEESNIIEEFVFVPFHDPAVGPPTVTRNIAVFKTALSLVRVYGGGDCPEKSLGGIQLALKVSRPSSYIYVFTDATASDYRDVSKVLDAVQRKKSQVVFVLTGHCNDLHKPHYKVYQQIAAASSGQVFNLNKTSVHKVLDFVRSSVRGRSVNLGALVNPAGYNYSKEIPIDSTLGEVTVSVAGSKPQISVTNPSGVLVTGPPKLITTLDLAEIMVVKVLEPERGNWTITVGSEDSHSVRVTGLSNLTFSQGFSVETPKSMSETSYRPLEGTYNQMLIKLTQTDRPVEIDRAEILSLNGSTLFELPLKKMAKGMYLAVPFLPPDDLFYVAINGRDEFKQELRRIGATAVQAKPADVPFLTVTEKISAYPHSRVTLSCHVESLVPHVAMWTKDSRKIQPQISSLQSKTIEYEIEDMDEEDVGTYACVARNVAGISLSHTEVSLVVLPPEVAISPVNVTVNLGDNLTISCIVNSGAPVFMIQLSFNGSKQNYEQDVKLDQNVREHIFTKNITVSESDEGTYSCIAANRGGKTVQSSYISIQSNPTAQILGPHIMFKPKHTDIQIVCTVESAYEVMWVHNNKIIERKHINGTYNAMLDIKDITEDGKWECIAVQGLKTATDIVEVQILFKPQVSIEGAKNITVLNGTVQELTCVVTAKPYPRIIWHRETDKFLNHTITELQPNTYKSVLKLNSKTDAINGTYFCFGENSEGIHQDYVNITLRRKMTLVQMFSDTSVELYSLLELRCKMDSYPPAQTTWYHNGTELMLPNVHLSHDNSTLYLERVDFIHLGSYACNSHNGFESKWLNGSVSVHGLDAPSILKETNNIKVQKGFPANITCSILKSNPEPSISWQYRSETAHNFTSVPDDVMKNRFGIKISNVRIDHAGTYRCLAENVVGRDSMEVNLTVQYPPELADLKDSEKPMEVKSGTQVRLSCQSVGSPPPIITWTKDYAPVRYSKNVYVNTKELVINKATIDDSGLYTCHVSSALGNVRKNFTVFVYVPPTIPTVGSQPELDILEGQLVELPCEATGFPKPEVTWTQNGYPVNDSRKYIDEFGLRFVANLTDFGDYTCIAMNDYGNTSRTFQVYIWMAPNIDPPLITKTEVLTGADVTLKCDAVGFPVPVILWQYEGRLLMTNTTSLSFDDIGNLHIKGANSTHEGNFVCIAENMVGAARKSIYLNVNEPPTILSDNYTGNYVATNLDRALVIPCKVGGKPRPFVIWAKDGVYIGKDSRYSIDHEGTITISSSPELSGNYTCIAKNKVGIANRTVSVVIYSLPQQLQSEETHTTITLIEGSQADVECPLARNPDDIVKWYKHAKLIATNNLQFSNVSRDNTSSYACVITNIVITMSAKVYINVEWPPKFLNDENVLEKHVAVVKGNDWYGDCSVDSNPRAKGKWLFNSRPLLGEDGTKLKLINIQTRHMGIYTCIASNVHGTVSRKYILDVLIPPFISKFDLLDIQLKEGTDATLECNAKGNPQPNIKWSFNNTNWHLQNTTLTAFNIQSKFEGLFRCDATNTAGSTYLVYRVSVIASARVKEIVAYDIEGGQGRTVTDTVEVKQGSNIRISCVSTGNPVPIIQWIRSGNTVSENVNDISYADLVLNDIQASHAGLYSCLSTNEGGTDERRVKMVVYEPPQIFQNIFESSNQKEINIQVLSGQSFYLHCHPYGSPMPEVYWFWNGQPLRSFDDTMVFSDYGEVVMVRNALYEYSGNYTCVARNKIGETRLVYLVDVLVPPPTPKESVKHIATRIGKNLTLTCPVEGSPLPYVKWIKQPYTEISETSEKMLLENDDYNLTLINPQVTDSGKYACLMINKAGSTEITFDVTVEQPPNIAANLKGEVVETHVIPVMRSVVLKCEVDGNPAPKITWLKDTQEITDNSRINRVLHNSLLSIWDVQTTLAGQYVCVGTNRVGSAVRRYNVIVQVPGKWSDWSPWSYCSVACGLGRQERTRRCQYIDENYHVIEKTTNPDRILLDESACKGPSIDKRKCHMPPCEEDDTHSHWSLWSKWSSCSATCGSGSQARTRRCKSTQCDGDNVQIRKCPNLPRCESNRDPSSNDVFTSDEEVTENNPYIPEATFEVSPDPDSEIVQDVENIFTSVTDTINMPVYFDVNVSENLDGSDNGPCEVGFMYNSTTNSCNDIDECLVEGNQCHATQLCANTAGAYRCGCARGAAARGAGQRCMDINECELARDNCEFACVNTAGGFVCACPKHLRLHLDRRHCVAPHLYRMPYSEVQQSEVGYISMSMELPVKNKPTKN